MAGPIHIFASRKYALFFWTFLFLTGLGLSIIYVGQNGLSNSSKAVRVTACAIVAALSAFGIYSTRSKRFEYKPVADPKEPFIEISEEEVICSFPSTNKEDRVKWAELEKVQVLTTDDGPGACDVFIVLRDGHGKGAVIPQDREECKRIVDIIFKLPGFDFRTFTEAMGSSDVKWFDVWVKPDASSN